MLGFSIFLLTTCGLVSIQGWRPLSKNFDTNTNVNSFRRFNNENRNMNFLSNDDYRYRPPQSLSPYYNDEAAAETAAASEQSAGDEADKIEPIDDGLAIAVGKAVLRVLNARGLRIPRSLSARRNTNFNSNYNLNIMGRGSLDENGSPSDASASAMNGDSARYTDPQNGGSNYYPNVDERWKTGSMGKILPLYIGYEPGSRGDQMDAGMLRDDQKLAGSEMMPQSTDGVIFIGDTSPEDSNSPAEQASIGSRTWGDTNKNTNLNMNNFGGNGYRRNANTNTNVNLFHSKPNANPTIYRRNFGRGSSNVEPHGRPRHYGPIY